MRLVVRARYAVLAGAILLLASQAALFVSGGVQWRFFNAPEEGSVSGNFAMLPGAGRADALEMMRELQRATEAVAARYEAEHGRSPVTYALAEVGGNTGRPLDGDRDEDLLGSIAIELIDADLRPYSSFAFVADLQDEVRQTPLTETVSFRGWRSGPGGDALSVRLYGAETAVLKSAAEALKADLGAYPVVSALSDTLAYDKEELILDLTPQGRALGFDIGTLGRTLRDRLGGIEAATFPVGQRSATVRVELPEGELTADFLDRTMMRTEAGRLRAAGRHRDGGEPHRLRHHKAGERAARGLGHRGRERGRPGGGAGGDDRAGGDAAAGAGDAVRRGLRADRAGRAGARRS